MLNLIKIHSKLYISINMGIYRKPILLQICHQNDYIRNKFFFRGVGEAIISTIKRISSLSLLSFMGESKQGTKMLFAHKNNLKNNQLLSTHWKLGENIIPLSSSPIHINNNEFPHREDWLLLYLVILYVLTHAHVGCYVCQQYQNSGHDQVMKHLSFSRAC